jgi:hypothetical protein
MAALSAIHDVTGRRLESSIYSWDIYEESSELQSIKEDLNCCRWTDGAPSEGSSPAQTRGPARQAGLGQSQASGPARHASTAQRLPPGPQPPGHARPASLASPHSGPARLNSPAPGLSRPPSVDSTTPLICPPSPFTFTRQEAARKFNYTLLYFTRRLWIRIDSIRIRIRIQKFSSIRIRIRIRIHNVIESGSGSTTVL